jgi:hypothetical protein
MVGTTTTWAPVVRLDLTTASRQAFDDTLTHLFDEAQRLKQENALPPIPFDRDGWFDITPQMAEAALMNSAGNREIMLSTVRAFAADMQAEDWEETGETICVVNSKLTNGHNRLLAALLGGVPFRCFVVVTARGSANVFAYYDSGKKRTPADALHIAGWNSSGRPMATAISNLALRYDEGKLGCTRQKKFRTVNPREVLQYVAAHPDFRGAAQLMLGTYPEAVQVIRSKPAAIFFAWLVLRAYDEVTLNNFCTPLGTGAQLEEDSPILAARNKLVLPVDSQGNKMADRTRLAYINTAFSMHVEGRKMPRTRGGRIHPLELAVDQAFPRIEPPIAQAAE